MPDSATPLCTYAQFTESAYGDLVSAYSTQAVSDLLVEATRLCEEEAGRRFVPFTVTENHRAEGIDPDEYADSVNLPMSIQSTLGASYAQAIGAQDLVRHCWLDQKASRYPDMWEYSNLTINLIRSYGGTQSVPISQLLSGPEPDTGHVWFQLGLFLPIGTRIQVTYTAGYTTIPASLVRACKFMTAYLVVRELEPATTDHDPDQLHTDALLALSNWQTQ